MDPQALRPVVSRSSLIWDWFHAGNGWKKSQEDSSQAWWMIEASVLGLYPRASFIYNTDTFHWFQPSPQCLSVAGESRDRSVTDWVLNSCWILDQLFTGSDGKMSKVVVSSVKDKPIVLIYRRKESLRNNAYPVHVWNHSVSQQKLSSHWVWALPVADKEWNWEGSSVLWHGLTGGF